MLAVMRNVRRVSRATILVLLIVVAGGLAGPIPSAGAHAVVIDTAPSPGALLADAPTEVSISFNENISIEADSIVVIDAEGTVVSDAAASTGSTMTAPIEPSTTGWHAVSWWAVSADGHPISGAWTFRIGDGDDAAPEGLEAQASAAATPGRTTRWTYIAVQWASTLTAVIAVGTVFAMLTIGHRQTLTPLALAASATAAAFALAAAAINGPFSAVSRGWFDGPASNHYLGRAVILGAATLVLAATRPRHEADAPRRLPPPLLLALLLAGAALCLPVMVGHTRTDGTAATIGVMSHLMVGGAWLGAVPAVVLLVRSGVPGKPVLTTFSRAATWLLALTLVAGTASAALLSGGPGNMARTWGFTLFVKIALVGVAITAGAWTRWNVVPHADEFPPRQASPALAVEAIALVLVIAASVALTHNGPPSVQETVVAGPVVIDKTVDEVRLQLIIDPAEVGSNEIHLFILDAAGIPRSVEEATVTLSSEDLEIGRIEQPITNLGAGHFMGTTEDLGLPGTWDVHVVVRPDRFSQVELTDEFEVRG